MLSAKLRLAFARTCATLFALGFLLSATRLEADTAPFGAARLVERDGVAQLRVDGQPYYLLGAAFFYERLPRDLWEPSIVRLRALGVNTLDLYLPWNWHELADGDFDFTGRTNPRRDLAGLLALARRYGMHLVIRPGPVIRNEWRNGGYPAWLLERPEYGMPQHDRLEGRYPPTATRQNADSDGAAAEWLANATHLRYAERWLRRVAAELRPYSGLVIAWQIDDDQAAYIDNDTWPAPHLHAYLDRLAAIVRSATSPQLPLYINTYEMRVTASSPLWAMGNWYQSAAYAIGEHDRTALEFATGLLLTQQRRPLVMSEFQAGWLEDPGDVLPRAADPSNTTLALHTLLGMGMHGAIDFPMQDTLAPAGWEAPFSNAFYAWDAALQIDPARTNARYAPTAAFGSLIARYGTRLAQTRRALDAGIAWLPSISTNVGSDNAQTFALEARTQAMQGFCRRTRLACELVDLRYADAERLARYPLLLLPMSGVAPAQRRFPEAIAERLRTYSRRHPVFSDAAVANVATTAIVHAATSVDAPEESAVRPLDDEAAAAALLRGAHHARVVDLADASLLVSRGDAFLDVVNYDPSPHVAHDVTVRLPHGRVVVLPTLRIGARDAIFLSLDDPANVIDADITGSGEEHVVVNRSNAETHGSYEAARPLAATLGTDAVAVAPSSGDTTNVIPLRSGEPFPGTLPHFAAPARATATLNDVYRDGEGTAVLDNGLVRIIAAPGAGGRAFAFEDEATHRNAFTTVGALRDDVKIQPPLSTTDRIGKYTRTFPAGFFNRPYDATIVSDPRDALVRMRYHAPDAVPAGATFERVLRLTPNSRTLEVRSIACFGDGPGAAQQRAVSIASLVAGDPHDPSHWIVLRTGEPAAFRWDTSYAERTNGLGLYDAASGDLIAVTWAPHDVEEARLQERRDSVVVRLTLAPHPATVAYTYTNAGSPAAARELLQKLRQERGVGEANLTNAGEVAKWYTQSPQKRPSESSCGFESHLPQNVAYP